MANETSSRDVVAQLRREKAPVEHPFLKMRRTARNLTVDAEGYWSYPALIPADDEAALWLSLVLTTVSLPGKQRTALFRPKCSVVTKPQTTLLVRYDHFRLGHDPFPKVAWDTPLAMFPHQSVSSLTYGQLAQREASLLAMYPAAQASFLQTGRLPADFRRQYLDLIHPVFLPFLKPLAPAFVTALDVPGYLHV